MNKSKTKLTYYTQETYKYKEIIRNPFITDKTTRLLENNQYSFIVDPKSNKNEIKRAIELLYTVKVIKVNTSQLARKTRRVGKYLGRNLNIKKQL